MSQSFNHWVNGWIDRETAGAVGGTWGGGMDRTMLMCVQLGGWGEAGVLFGGGRGKVGPVPSEGQATVRYGGSPHPCLGAPLPSAVLTTRAGSWSLCSSMNL